MVNTKKISLYKAFLLSMIAIAVLSVVAISCFWIYYEIWGFKKASDTLKSEYINSHKERITDEIKRAVDFIEYKKSQTKDRLKEDIKNRTYEAYEIALNLYREHEGRMKEDDLRKMVKDALRPIRFNNGRGYYFATDLYGSEQLFADRPELEGKNLIGIQDTRGKFVIQDMIQIVTEKKEGFYEYTWTKPNMVGGTFPKIAFIKYFEPFNWFIGTGEYLDDVEQDIKSEVLDWISKINFGNEGYIFAGQWDGLSLSGPARGRNMYDVTDDTGVKIVQELIALSRNGGGFLNYTIPKFEGKKSAPKVSYVEAVDDWKWYIGAGVYVDEIESVLALKQDELKMRIQKHIIKIALILFSIIIGIFGIVKFVSGKIKENLESFSDFFAISATAQSKIDPNRLFFSDFSRLADSANRMIDERQVVENKLIQSEKKYRELYEKSLDGFTMIDLAEKKIIESNSTFRDMLGYSETELKEKTCNDITPSKWHDIEKEIVEKEVFTRGY